MLVKGIFTIPIFTNVPKGYVIQPLCVLSLQQLVLLPCDPLSPLFRGGLSQGLSAA